MRHQKSQEEMTPGKVRTKPAQQLRNGAAVRCSRAKCALSLRTYWRPDKARFITPNPGRGMASIDQRRGLGITSAFRRAAGREASPPVSCRPIVFGELSWV